MASSNYATLPEDLIAPPPYKADNCTIQLMFLEGDRDTQQQFCDDALNRPSGGQCVFKAVSNYVLLAMLFSDNMRSEAPTYIGKGYTREYDIGFWTLVQGGLKNKPAGFYWMPSYLYVDSGAAAAAGRENFGYPKSACDIKRSTGALSHVGVEVRTQHFPVHGADRPLKDEVILKVAPANRQPTDWSSLGDLFLRGLGGLIGSGTDGIPQGYFDVPQIMLRQVRDATRPAKTSVQEILVATPQILVLQDSLAPVPGGARVDLTPSESHNVRKIHGFPRETIYTDYVFAARGSYKVPKATRLWPV